MKTTSTCSPIWRQASLMLAPLFLAALTHASPVLKVVPVSNQGFDVYADGVLVAPIRLAANGAIVADNVVSNESGIQLSGLHTKDSLAVTFAAGDFVSIAVPPPTNQPTGWQPLVRFQLTIANFNTNRWMAMFPGAPAPFHFLACAMPSAQVWHQRGWLNATPVADPFPLLQDVHTGSPEISCLWNRNWSYICPVGAHPIPMIGLWDPAAGLYVGYDFQGARATDQSERYLSTAYCWGQSGLTNFITLAYPYGGVRYGQQVYPRSGEVLASWFNLQIDTDLAATEDPNERFQTRLFYQYTNVLPRVPAMNDLGWLPGGARLSTFSGAPSLNLYATGGETTFYPNGTVLLNGWGGHVEMPVDAAVRRGDTTGLNNGRGQLETLLTNYAMSFTAGGEPCLFWQKPLSGAWLTNWGGAAVTTLHESEGWYTARVLVELYRYDRAHNQVRASYLPAIDGVFNWAKHFIWSRNEFADVPSSPFAIGSTLCSAFLLDYYFTFRGDALRGTNATLALHMADTITWRYLHPWAMDSDRYDGALDSAFLAEPNSGRDWAGLGCANEVNWNIDSLTQVYVHTGDARMRYYLRGMLQRWPVLYQANYEDSLAQYNSSEALTEGLGVFDGSGPGRGTRYNYGFSPTLPLNEPVGASTMRVIAGAQACIAFDKNGAGWDVADYRTGGDGSCAFRLISTQPTPFDVSFSYPFVDISALTVTRVRNGQTNVLSGSQVTRPTQSPSSLYLSQMQAGDIVSIGNVPAGALVTNFDASLVYNETNVSSTTNGSFATLTILASKPLLQDWTNLSSFAGIVPGDHWNYGIPIHQGLYALTNQVPASAPGATVLLLTYAPPAGETLTRSPNLLLDDGSTLALSGGPVLDWRGWPLIFTEKVLMDYAVMPGGRALAQVNPNGTLVMALTEFTGTPSEWQPLQNTLSNASAAFIQQEQQDLAVLALQASYALLPTGKIALLPLNTAGAGANFAAATGLRKKWDALTEAQMVNSNIFNAARYPVAFYLGSENYVKTVVTNGDGKTAITQYLAGGGTLVVLATGPFPFYYGYGPADAAGPSDPLLPTLGMPLQGFEQAPAGIFMQLYTSQTILHSVPQQFAFPPGDQRLRALKSTAVNAANRYQPMLKAVDSLGNYYGEAVFFIVLKTGPASGGRVLYVWDTLQSGPQGQAVMADTVTWLLDAVLRPPVPRFDSFQLTDSNHVALNFTANSNLDYVVQYRNTLDTGAWATLQDFSTAPTNRSLRLTATLAGTASRFYRLTVGP